jgi:hypothetical protein
VPPDNIIASVFTELFIEKPPIPLDEGCIFVDFMFYVFERPVEWPEFPTVLVRLFLLLDDFECP